jgi:hypothetical protein
MASEKMVVLKETDLSNNCPECFNKNLKLSFYQKHVYGKLFHRTTNQVSHQMVCNKCGSNIYPAKWTDDIERIFNYYQKMAVPKKSSLKFTSLFYLLIFTFIALIGTIVFLFSQGILTI